MSHDRASPNCVGNKDQNFVAVQNESFFNHCILQVLPVLLEPHEEIFLKKPDFPGKLAVQRTVA